MNNNHLPTLQHLLKQLQQIPYLASKNLYRVATYFLELDPEKMDVLCSALKQAQQRLKKCTICYAWKEVDNDCLLCVDKKRDQSLICVVQSWQELMAIEKTGGYAGSYHVLGGVISPLDGIGPEDLSIDALVKRVASGVQEIILATNQTPEGEATAAYIAHKLQSSPVKVSCLARGMPVGSSIEYLDRLTVYKALSERRPF